MEKSDLPFGSEFSPSQINLPDLLVIVDEHQGDIKMMETEIMGEFFMEDGRTEYTEYKLSNNCRLSLQAYQIIDKNGSFTEFGSMLFNFRDDEDRLYK